jgi:hypothetical protein
MTQITREEAVKNMQDMIVSLEARITELTRALSVQSVDDQPYVVVVKRGSSALKLLSEKSFNMTAQGLDAQTFTKSNADRLAREHSYMVMKKREFYASQIKSAGETIAWAKEIMERKVA